MKSFVFISASLLGASGIVLGAFAAHTLKKIITPEALHSFEVGVRYQMYHALFLMLVGSILRFTTTLEKWIVYLCIAGVCCFSFSIYGLALQEVHQCPVQFLGPLTPLGGIMLVASWLLLLLYLVRTKTP